MKYSTKLFIVFMVLIVSSFISMSILIPIRMNKYAQTEIYLKLESLSSFNINDDFYAYKGYGFLQYDDEENYVHYEDGNPSSINVNLLKTFVSWGGVQESKTKRYETEFTDHTLLYVINKNTDGSFTVAYTYTSATKLLAYHMSIDVIVALFVIYVVVGVFGFIAFRHLSRRLNKVTNHVKQIADYNWNNQLIVEYKDEIGLLAANIEWMRKRLIRQENQKKEMFQNLSHDLKTPVAVIKSYTHAIKDGVYNDDLDEALDIISSETDHLEKKIKDILYLAKIENINQNNNINIQEINLKDIINRIVERNRHRNNYIIWDIQIDDIVLKGNQEMWTLALENIIDNFLRYAKTKIRIVTKDDELIFYNDGEHIDTEFMKDLFTPYKVANKGQFGLGLAITKKIVNIFGYDIQVENTDNGVIFKIR